jgi:hypothetical protein
MSFSLVDQYKPDDEDRIVLKSEVGDAHRLETVEAPV